MLVYLIQLYSNSYIITCIAVTITARTAWRTSTGSRTRRVSSLARTARASATSTTTSSSTTFRSQTATSRFSWLNRVDKARARVARLQLKPRRVLHPTRFFDLSYHVLAIAIHVHVKFVLVTKPCHFFQCRGFHLFDPGALPADGSGRRDACRLQRDARDRQCDARAAARALPAHEGPRQRALSVRFPSCSFRSRTLLSIIIGILLLIMITLELCCVK